MNILIDLLIVVFWSLFVIALSIPWGTKGWLKDLINGLKKEKFKDYLRENWVFIVVFLLSILIAVYYWNLPVFENKLYWIGGKKLSILLSIIMVVVGCLSAFVFRRVYKGYGIYDKKEIWVSNVTINTLLLLILPIQFFLLKGEYIVSLYFNPNYMSVLYGVSSIVYGNYLPKIKKDIFKNAYDVRKYSEEAVRKANRFTGKILVVFGFICLLYAIPTFIIPIKSRWYNFLWIALLPNVFLYMLVFYFPRLKKRYQKEIESKIDKGKIEGN